MRYLDLVGACGTGTGGHLVWAPKAFSIWYSVSYFYLVFVPRICTSYLYFVFGILIPWVPVALEAILSGRPKHWSRDLQLEVPDPCDQTIPIVKTESTNKKLPKVPENK